MKRKKIFIIIPLLLILGIISNCNKKNEMKTTSNKNKLIQKVNSQKEFEEILPESEKKLLVIDLYADWCGPCKLLSPILETIAKEHTDKAKFLKINVDEQKNIASMFQVRSIPYVVFIKNNRLIDSLLGLRSEKAYINMIQKHAF